MKNRIHTLFKLWKDTPEKVLFRSYLLALVILLVFHLFMGLAHLAAYQFNIYESKPLDIHDFDPVDVEIIDDATVITETDDAQLIYTGNVRNIKIKCEFLQDPGEFVSFYNAKANHSFGAHQMMYAKWKDGYYVFEYPLGTRQVRIDLGVVPSATVHISEIRLNDKNLAQMLGYTNSELFYLFVIPPIIFLLMDTLGDIYRAIKEKRKPSSHPV